MELRAAFDASVEQLLDESRRVWARIASDLRMQLVSSAASRERLPILSGRIDGIAVTLTAAGERSHGFETRAEAVSRHPMRGRVLVRAATPWDGLWRRLGRSPLGDPELDARLTVRSSSGSLRRAVIDERTIETLQRLADRSLRALSYVDGAVVIAWAGVERDAALVVNVLELAAHLAVTGSEPSPYR